MSTATPHPGMGAIVHGRGVAFRVWAPNAAAVFVSGGFNDWSEDAAPMSREADGTWYRDVPEAKPSDGGWLGRSCLVDSRVAGVSICATLLSHEGLFWLNDLQPFTACERQNRSKRYKPGFLR